MQVNCKNCGRLFMPAKAGQRLPRVFCETKCRLASDRHATKLRYRRDPAFREAVKANNLQRYHRKTVS